MAVDISEELFTIKNSIYGSDMRQAIYDALDKLARSSGGGSPVTTSMSLLYSNGLMGEVVDLEEVND